jgi:hypothetical protein
VAAAPARPQPILSDSEVLTIECVGEFWGIDTDKGLDEHFGRHWRDWFPALGRIHRTTFVRQAANLWAVKAQLRQQLLGQVGDDPVVSILDSFPMPVCRFGRADRCRRLAGLAALGRDEGRQADLLRPWAHLRVCWPGVIVDGRLAPANLHDLTMAEELLAGVQGWALGTGPLRAWAGPGCWPTKARGCCATPISAAISPAPARRLVQARRRIETVIGQLVVHGYHAKRVWARDAWHLWSRWQRKLLSHTLVVYLCQQAGLGSLRFADLLTN